MRKVHRAKMDSAAVGFSHKRSNAKLASLRKSQDRSGKGIMRQ
jgi:hypothetical protein